MTQQKASPNIVSDPPLMQEIIDSRTGKVSRVWAVWFRDIYKRIADKRGNAIDESLDTTDEVIEQVLINIENIETNAGDISDNTSNIADNTSNIADNTSNIADNTSNIADNQEDISTNEDNILNLEHRTLSTFRPTSYDELIGYAKDQYIVYPITDPQNYYRAIDVIPSPAGAFNPLLWKQVSLIDNDTYIELTREQAKSSFVAAGYGGIGVDAVEAIGTINSTFQTIQGFDIDLISTPKDVTYDKANHGLKLDRQGVWEVNVKIALTFDEVNNGRQIQLRSYNATTATAGAILFNYFIGRNQAGVNIPLTFAVEIPQGNEGDLIQLQIGSASDTFANSDNIGTIYQVKHISELKEDLGA